MLPVNPEHVRRLLAEAARLERAGRLAEAAARLEEAHRLDPADGRIAGRYGFVLMRLGKALEARPLLEAGLEAEPGNAALWKAYLIGLERLGDREALEAARARARAAMASAAGAARGGRAARPVPERELRRLSRAIADGRLADAAARLAALRRDHGEHPDLLVAEAGLARAGGNRLGAEAALRRALALAPDHGPARRALAELFLRTDRPRQALPLLVTLLREDERDEEARLLLGEALMALGHHRRALEEFARLSPARRRDPKTTYLEGLALVRSGCHREGIARLRKAARQGLSTPVGMASEAEALHRLGRHEEALAVLDRLERKAPGVAVAALVRAEILAALGRLEEARAGLAEVIARAPHKGHPYLAYMRLGKVRADDPVLARLRRIAEDESLPIEDRRSMAFAMAKALEDIGEHAQVFRWLDLGNGLMARDFPWDREKDEAAARRYREHFTPTLVARFAGRGFAEARPVFIVGLPRSGTTLFERIIAAHPQAAAAGESGILREEIHPLVERLIAQGEGALDDDDFRAAGQRVWERMQEAFGPAAVITDKSITTWSILGYGALALPEARFIVVNRDPCDNALSMYKNLFASGAHLYTYRLEDIAAMRRLFERQIAFWKERLPGRVSEMSYEDLVADPEAGARRLVEMAGLPWDDACLEFWKDRGPVHTLSVAQVRQPVYRSSAGGWKRYEKEMQRFVDAYAREGAAAAPGG